MRYLMMTYVPVDVICQILRGEEPDRHKCEDRAKEDRGSTKIKWETIF